MKSKLDLLRDYQEEKALVIGSLAERTGLEPFQSFNEWLTEYEIEYRLTHDVDNPLTMEEAVALMDAELEAFSTDEDDDEIVLDPEDIQTANEEEVTMSNTTDNTAVVETAATASPVPAAPKRTRKPAAKKATGEKKAPKSRAKSKADKGRTVFNRMYPQVLAGEKTRGDVIKALMGSRVGLTAAYASTFYQNEKKKVSA
jgi:hypothetical protein